MKGTDYNELVVTVDKCCGLKPNATGTCMYNAITCVYMYSSTRVGNDEN